MHDYIAYNTFAYITHTRIILHHHFQSSYNLQPPPPTTTRNRHFANDDDNARYNLLLPPFIFYLCMFFKITHVCMHIMFQTKGIWVFHKD